jgi:hypothetical protein
MSSPVDPNDVMMTGENSFIGCSADGGTTPVAPASFARSGGAGGRAAELVTAKDAEILLSWEDFLPAFVLNMPPGSANRPIGVFSTFFPARAARIVLDGKAAAGAPYAEKRGERESTSACLAWSETWVRPRA